MPVPRNKKNRNLAKKQKQILAVRGSIPSTLASDVGDADGYVERANIVCRLLGIPGELQCYLT